ncbi:phage virion morphogenesis protein [Undibacterium umbellatum]|uniref:phage virion morphogenesis protein n=1 Tax=Undibacterium umbellatum TaxID=2762300 RepID=UPI002E31A29E|nr:phage virion morphogenesis protein [Undibacterium umbellatum]
MNQPANARPAPPATNPHPGLTKPRRPLPYAPHKQRKNIRGKQGRIKKQKACMFNKLRTNTHLKAKPDGNGLEVGFYGRVARIARVHQYGLRDRVVAGGGDVQYEQRRVLGLDQLNLEVIGNWLHD